MRNIEEGALVLVVASDDPDCVGMAGIVTNWFEGGYYDPDDTPMFSKGAWEVDTGSHDYTLVEPSCNLIRIDGDRMVEIETQEECTA